VQSKKESLIETILNIGSGFVLSWIATSYLLSYWFTISVPIKDAFWITVIYTFISILRSYFWRRIFNHYLKKKNSKENGEN